MPTKKDESKRSCTSGGNLAPASTLCQKNRLWRISPVRLEFAAGATPLEASPNRAMQFRQSGQRNDRRRRVLSDCSSSRDSHPRSGRASGSNSLASGEQVMRKSENYGDAEFLDRQPRLTDLVPTNLFVFLIMFLIGLAIVAGLELLYAWMPNVAAMTSDGRVATFDLDGEGSLAVWFSSMTLAMAGLVAILVFTTPRHNIDIYQAVYRS